VFAVGRFCLKHKHKMWQNKEFG